MIPVFFWMLLIVMTPSQALAQRDTGSSTLLDLAKSVALDPTTYAPAGLSYESLRKDWNTSQAMFQQGWLERNPQYTASGLPNDKPVSVAAGNQRIRREALGCLQLQVFNNLSVEIAERSLSARYPAHRTLFRTLSWIERISTSSYFSYLASVDHFRQARTNEQLARQSSY
jgi:hypothetical protein